VATGRSAARASAHAVCECGASVLVGSEPLRHQVFDVPPVRAVVNEYRLFSGCCAGCGKKHRASLPAGVPTGQIGPRALALIGALGTRYHLTQFKIRDLLAQVTGVDFSVGAISQAHGKLAQALATPVSEAIKSLATHRSCTWTRRASRAKAPTATGCGAW